MELPETIKRVVAKEITKHRCIEVNPEDVTLDMFVETVERYIQQFPYIPQSWQPIYSKIKQKQ